MLQCTKAAQPSAIAEAVDIKRLHGDGPGCLQLETNMLSLEEQHQTSCLMIWFNGDLNPECFELHSGELVAVKLGKSHRKNIVQTISATAWRS